MKGVRIDYTIREGVDLNEVTQAIKAFVAGIHEHHPDHRYTSYQSQKEPRRFTHIGELLEDKVADLQAQPFFSRFNGFLREHCESGPEVTWISPVASTK